MNKIVLFILVWLYLTGCSDDYYIREANRYCSLGELEKAIDTIKIMISTRNTTTHRNCDKPKRKSFETI